MTVVGDRPFKEGPVDPWENCRRTTNVRKRVVVEGNCTACGHRTCYDFGPVVVTGADEEGSAVAETAGRATVYCECGYPHAGRPEGEIFLGCGAYWFARPTDGES
jgi:hypothetical protein